jgi:hypothetical protein
MISGVPIRSNITFQVCDTEGAKRAKCERYGRMNLLSESHFANFWRRLIFDALPKKGNFD